MSLSFAVFIAFFSFSFWTLFLSEVRLEDDSLTEIIELDSSPEHLSLSASDLDTL